MNPIQKIIEEMTEENKQEVRKLITMMLDNDFKLLSEMSYELGVKELNIYHKKLINN